MKPILDANGRPYYVSERDPIKANHLNALTDWTHSSYETFTVEHSEEGHHTSGYHPAGILWLGMNRDDNIHVLSTYRGKTLAEDPNLISTLWYGPGVVEVTLAEELPENPFFHAAPRSYKQDYRYAVYITSPYSFEIHQRDSREHVGTWASVIIWGS